MGDSMAPDSGQSNGTLGQGAGTASPVGDAGLGQTPASGGDLWRGERDGKSDGMIGAGDSGASGQSKTSARGQVSGQVHASVDGLTEGEGALSAEHIPATSVPLAGGSSLPISDGSGRSASSNAHSGKQDATDLPGISASGSHEGATTEHASFSVPYKSGVSPTIDTDGPEKGKRGSDVDGSTTRAMASEAGGASIYSGQSSASGRQPTTGAVSDIREASDTSGVSTPMDLMEPVPRSLLDILPREVVKALILIKGTRIFGRHTRALQELISTYLRLSQPLPGALSESEVPALMSALSDYLGVEPDFLAFAFRFSAWVHPQDDVARSVSIRMTHQLVLSEMVEQTVEIEAIQLASYLTKHLTLHRWYYDAGHVKALLLPRLKGKPIPQALFSDLLRLLYDDQAQRVELEWERVTSPYQLIYSGQAKASILDQAKQLFIEASLDAVQAPFNLQRVFARIRRLLQPELAGVYVPSSRLADIRGAFHQEPFMDVEKGGRRKAFVNREQAIIRFYNMLSLDLVLEGVGPRFFDNIPFSFELLLTKYRGKLLNILKFHRFNAELAHFFTYSDASNIFEQVRRILPGSASNKVSRTFQQVTDLLMRLQWVNLTRDALKQFVALDAYPYYLSPETPLPPLGALVYEILNRASREGLLSDAFRLMFSETSTARILGQLHRKVGRQRTDLLISVAAASQDFDAVGVESYRLLILSEAAITEEEAASLTLEAILTYGKFPVGHVYQGRDPMDHPDYLQRLIGRGKTIERLFPTLQSAQIERLTGLLDRPQLLRAVAARFNIRIDQARRLLQSWYDFAARSDWQMEDFLRAVIRQPGPSRNLPGKHALNQAAARVLTATGSISWWALTDLSEEEGAAPGLMREGLRMSFVMERVRGRNEDWMEIYFGLLTSKSVSAAVMLDLLSVWTRTLSVLHHRLSKSMRFVKLAESIRRILALKLIDIQQLHLAWLKEQSFFNGLSPSLIPGVYGQLLKAGIPQAALDLYMAQDAPESLPVNTSTQTAILSPIPDGEDFMSAAVVGLGWLDGTLKHGSREAAIVMSALRSWVAGRRWTDGTAARFLKVLPSEAFDDLLQSLFGMSGMPGYIEAWGEWLKDVGVFSHRQAAMDALKTAIFTRRLWRYRTPRRWVPEWLMALGLPEILLQHERFSTHVKPGLQGLPADFFRQVLDVFRSGSKADVEKLLSRWTTDLPLFTWPRREQEAVKTIRLAGLGTFPIQLIEFLESGIFPAADVPGQTALTERELSLDVRKAGPGLFLTLPSLHESLLGRALDFFRPDELSTHIFQRLRASTADAALKRFLDLLEELSGHARVRLSDLTLFLKTYHRFFAGGTGKNPGRSEAFLRAALRIPAFSALAQQAIEQLPLTAARATRSAFLKQMIRRQLNARNQPTPELEKVAVFFLRTGLLHPESRFTDLPAMQHTISERILAGDRVLKSLIFQHVRDRLSRRRVRELFSKISESDVYDWIQPGLSAAMTMLMNLLRRRFGIDGWRAVGVLSERDRIERVLYWWSQTRPVPGHPVRILAQGLSRILSVLSDRQWTRIRQPALETFSVQERELWFELRALLPELLETPADADRRLASPSDPVEGPRMNEPDTDSDPVDGITIQNGGLVILWPYLGRLFTRLGLSDGKVFGGEEEQSRAIRLTEYLVTGSTEMEEHQLALNKVLCGTPLEFQVPASIELTPEEEELCTKMLAGVIRNWEKLKSTRPNTFRETFLKREARLYRVDDHWELMVSRKAYDMLLDTLPWNISMIQLSWMPERLVVHWK